MPLVPALTARVSVHKLSLYELRLGVETFLMFSPLSDVGDKSHRAICQREQRKFYRLFLSYI